MYIEFTVEFLSYPSLKLQILHLLVFCIESAIQKTVFYFEWSDLELKNPRKQQTIKIWTDSYVGSNKVFLLDLGQLKTNLPLK